MTITTSKRRANEAFKRRLECNSKLTKSRLKHLIKEEGKDSRMYKSLGLYDISRDEARHKRILQGLEKAR